MNTATPTLEFYRFLERAFDWFNRELFAGDLRSAVITVQRDKKVMGYFSANRWVSVKNERIHELAVNPAYFANYKMIEIFQTLVHEQCHMWQEDFGKTCRRTYHNAQWAEKMESVGLMPSHTGKPGGRRTGQKMADYPIAGGKFEQACISLIEDGWELPLVDRYPVIATPLRHATLERVGAEVSGLKEAGAEVLYMEVTRIFDDIVHPEQLVSDGKSSRKAKTLYQCGGCRCKVWGKPGLSIRCVDCDLGFTEH